MAVLRNQRTYPLVLKNDPLNVGIVAAYDWAAEDGSTTASNGKDHSGNARHYSLNGAAPTVVQTPGGKGRDTSLGGTVVGAYYIASGAVTVGLAVGTGDFTIFKRFRMPSQAPSSINSREIGRIADSAGGKVMFNLLESNSTGGYHCAIAIGGSNLLLWNSPGNPIIPAGSITSVHVTRIGGVLKAYINGTLIASNTLTLDLLATTGASGTIVGNYGSGDTMTDAVYLDDIYWSRGLSDAEVAAHAANPYSYYENQAAANAITISAPVAGATAGTSINISGAYSGGDSPTAIEASFNGGAWTVIDNTLSDGTYSGTLSGQATGTGTLSVRWANQTSVTASVANVTVAVAGIAFTAPSTQQSVRSYRMFQRDAQNRAAVRVSGTYTGAPTTIEYRWNGGSWATLDSAPAGGVFDKTVTLQGPGQGSFEVRFANATGVNASLTQVGVGDVFLVAGQSNNVGMSPIYIPPVAPSAHPSWQSILCAKDGNWKPHLESVSSPFDDRTNALYPVEVNSATPLGSYFGALATRIMAAGVPVAFIPCALGSSSLTQWAINTGTDWLYGAALARAAAVGDYKAVLWWQGEAETGSTDTKAQLVTKYADRVNDWFARTGKKWFIWAIDGDETGVNFQNVHAALLEVGQTNPNCAGWADLLGSFDSGIHYSTGAEINEIANRTFAALNTAYNYLGDNIAPTVTAASVANSIPGTITLAASESLDPAFVPAASAFAVAGRTVNSAAVSGSNIVLQVSPPIAYGDVVAVSYTKPATNGARDAVGNLLESFSGQAVTNNVAAPSSTVTGVIVTPATATVQGGGTLQLSATVLGANSPSQAVTWSRSPAAGSVSGAGLLTAPAATSAEQTITATATSQQDGTKSGSATITVPAIASESDEMSFTPSPSRTLTVSPTSKALTGGPWWNLANPAKPRGTKDPQATLDVTLNWAPWLADIGNPPIAKFTATIFGVTQVGAYAEGALTTMVFSGGTAAEATITFEIETATTPPLKDERTVYIDLVNL